MKVSIYIISKGRANRQKTREQLIALNIPHTTVVEPQDYQAYANALPGKYLVLDKNDQGVSYARNACLSDAIRKNANALNIIDDDMRITKSSACYRNGSFTRRNSRPLARHELIALYDWFVESEFGGGVYQWRKFQLLAPELPKSLPSLVLLHDAKGCAYQRKQPFLRYEP